MTIPVLQSLDPSVILPFPLLLPRCRIILLYFHCLPCSLLSWQLHDGSCLTFSYVFFSSPTFPQLDFHMFLPCPFVSCYETTTFKEYVTPKRFPSYLLFTFLIYFCFIFYLPWSVLWLEYFVHQSRSQKLSSRHRRDTILEPWNPSIQYCSDI